MATRRNKRENTEEDILIINEPDLTELEETKEQEEVINEEIKNESVKTETKKKTQSLSDFLF